MQVFLHKAAEKYLEHLNEPDKGRVKSALSDLSKDPPEGDIRPVVGQKGYFRLKIGDYRILFRYRDNDIFVTHIAREGKRTTKTQRGKKMTETV
jgi:mRNA interferase RelE/StbE